MSLLNFRATPRNGLDSPAQILMGRRLNTKLPVNSKLLSEKVDNDNNYKAVMANREEIKKHYDRSAKSIENLLSGDKATLINNDGIRKPVTIVARSSQPRSYIVEDEQGSHFRRTRNQLVVRTTSPTGHSSRRSNVNCNAGNAITQTVVMGSGIRRRRQRTAKHKGK